MNKTNKRRHGEMDGPDCSADMRATKSWWARQGGQV